ncbi:GTPase-activating Rap/Ran-GAP domain-like protein isoform 1 [Schistosoma japonicum]|uniref:GTPase-activating Rap/Ran-GAP domain-like protein 3 n=2 Tax=Schistosoma japonicum TaxID=6182 RepID=A0A4Z2D1R6_SCHJA|nr:GTPase-activating Rap/Ran-GAP domain-like protein isoform 1 [Schistosoma japonicum]
MNMNNQVINSHNSNSKVTCQITSGLESSKINQNKLIHLKRSCNSLKTLSNQQTLSTLFIETLNDEQQYNKTYQQLNNYDHNLMTTTSKPTSSTSSFENLSKSYALPQTLVVTNGLTTTTTTTTNSTLITSMKSINDMKLRNKPISSDLLCVKKKLQRQWATCSSLCNNSNYNSYNNNIPQHTTINNSGLYDRNSLISNCKFAITEKKNKSNWLFTWRQSFDRGIDFTTNWSNKSRVDRRRKLFHKLGYKSANEMYMSENTSFTSESNGFINNAGRFRSEVSVVSSKKLTETSPSYNNSISFDLSLKVKDSSTSLSENRLSIGNFENTNDCLFKSEEIPSNLHPGGFSDTHLLDHYKHTLIPTASQSHQSQRQIQQSSYDTGLNQLCNSEMLPVSSIQQSQSFGIDTSMTNFDDEYFQFDHDPQSFYNINSGINFKSTTTPLHLENPERETRWYFKYFLGKYHQLYCGYLTEHDPFLLAVVKDDMQTYGISQYRAILWRKTGSQKLCISYNPTNALTAKKVLNFFDIHRLDKGPREILNFEVQKDALTLEEQEGSVNFKFGVLYCIEGQTSDQEMYNNEKGSEQFERFVDLLGDRIGLKSWDRFKGGLDTKSNTTGIDSVYTIYEGHEIMFHVSTLLPYSTENRQQIERKRHVGNDIVNIIFVDGCPPGEQPSWTPSMMRTHFTHIFAVVTYDNEANVYRLNIFAEESVPFFGPPLHNPPEFKNPQEFREFLLVKLINGEKAAFRSPVFAQKRQRTLEMLLNAICTTYTNETNNGAIYRRAFSDVVVDSFNGVTTSKEQSRNDAHIRYGQMLKLNTIIRGDAPTSSITSGQSKKNLWQPKLIYKCTQSEIICGDVWGERLIVSTEQGTFGFKDQEPPALLIDKSVEVKQLEVAQFELLIIRYDKGREAKVAVIQLNSLTSIKPIDRTQVKKLSLEKTRGAQLFAVTKSPSHPLRLAAAVNRRIVIYQWHLFTGRSLSSWNQLAQPDPVENFQIIKEVHMIDSIQTLSFIEGIPGGKLCVGYRNQFILLDERSKETTQLFRTEGNRNQVVSALELWADEEHELLLCFTRTCHFQKLILTTPRIGSRRQGLPISSPADSSFNWNMKSSMETSTNKSSPVLSQASSSLDSPSPTSGSVARSCSPDPSFNSINSNLISEEKMKTSDFDFAWTFEPQQVAVCFPYIFGFNPSAIEIRLLINGSLVHTMLVTDCRLITVKGDIFFTSTSETLDYKISPTANSTTVTNNPGTDNISQQNDMKSIMRAVDQLHIDESQQTIDSSTYPENYDSQKHLPPPIEQCHIDSQSNLSSNSYTISSATCSSTGARVLPSNSTSSSTVTSSNLTNMDSNQPQTNFIYKIPIYSSNKQMSNNEN